MDDVTKQSLDSVKTNILFFKGFRLIAVLRMTIRPSSKIFPLYAFTSLFYEFSFKAFV